MTSIEKLVDEIEKYEDYPFFSDSDKIILSLLLKLAQSVEQLSKERQP